MWLLAIQIAGKCFGVLTRTQTGSLEVQCHFAKKEAMGILGHGGHQLHRTTSGGIFAVTDKV